MKLKNAANYFYQSAQGVLIEVAYSLAIVLTGAAIVYLVLILKWSSSRI